MKETQSHQQLLLYSLGRLSRFGGKGRSEAMPYNQGGLLSGYEEVWTFLICLWKKY